MSKPINVNNEAEFKKEVLESSTPVLVDFWAPWCMPCRMMAPVLDELSVQFEGKLKIVKVDTENAQNHPMAIKYQIQSIPNLKLFKAGEVIKDFIGFRPKEVFEKELAEFTK